MGDGIAFHTPNFDGNAPLICKRLTLPSFLWTYFNGVFGDLAESENWYQFGDMTINDVVQAFANAYDEMTECSMIGAIIPIATEVIPDNMLVCNGLSVLRSDYPQLAAVIDPQFLTTSWGLETITMPNLDGVFILGGRYPSHVGETGGAATHTLSVDEMPAHNHGYTPPVVNIDIEAPGAPDILAAGIGGTAQTGQTGNGQPHNNMPPYFRLRYVMIAK